MPIHVSTLKKSTTQCSQATLNQATLNKLFLYLTPDLTPTLVSGCG